MDFSDGKTLNEGLGDALLESKQSGRVYIEVKCQGKQNNFSDITQADWVRNATDFVRHHARVHAFFERHRSARHATIAGLLAGWEPNGMDLGTLWAGDVGLVYDGAKRREAGVANPEQLRSFLQNKWLLHVTLSGARLLRLADVPAVKTALERRAVDFTIEPNPQKSSSDRAGLAKIAVNDASGHALFTYHLYLKKGSGELVGRHKAHARLFDEAPLITVPR